MTQLQGYDPRTGLPTGRPVPETSGLELEHRIALAERASSTMAVVDRATKRYWLLTVARALEDAAEALVNEADQQTALGKDRLAGELERTVVQIGLFADILQDGSYLEVVIDDADLTARPVARPSLRRGMRPLGPVAVWAASNFPFAFGVIGGDTVSALAAGCPVIVKAHPSQPSLSEAIAETVTRGLNAAGAPEGAFAVIHGLPAGAELITDPRIRAGAFTGSVRGGRALFDQACSRPAPIPFFGELGSVNPVFVTPSGLDRAEEIADGLVTSVTLGAGQFCTKPGIAFIPAGGGIRETVARRVGEAEPAALLNAGIKSGYESGIGALEACTDVALVGGGTQPPADGTWVTPHAAVISMAAFLAEPSLYTEECFGPAVLLVEYADPADLLRAVDALPGCLAAAIHAGADTVGEQELCDRLIERLQDIAGRIVWNGWPTGVAVTWSMQHGGPYPACTNAASTSVGAAAIARFLRPVVFQGFPERFLPGPLRDDALTGVIRRNGLPEIHRPGEPYGA